MGWVHFGSVALLAACGARSHDVGPRDGDSDADSDLPTDPPSTDADVDTDADADTDTGSPTDTDTGSTTEVVGDCDPVADFGCLAPDEKCGIRYDAVAEGIVGACVVNGDKAAGERCGIAARPGYDGSYDDCGRSLGCFELRHDGGISRCHPLCACRDFDCSHDRCGESEYCATLDGISSVGVCQTTTACDPLAQTDCVDGENCYLLFVPDRTLTDCAEYAPLDGSGGEVGEACVYINNCARGRQCLVREAEPACTRFCDPLGGEPGCPVEEGACVAIESYERAGFCE